MTLNIFTHPVRKETLPQALKSWRMAFGDPPVVNVWKDGFNSTGLADGYIKAIQTCTDDYIFMLEHDWEFIRKPLPLSEITDMMRENNIHHLRFNKRANEPGKKDNWLIDWGGYCETPFVSNNPHIIDRKAYLKYIEQGWIQPKGKDLGVEEIISQHINGCIYGGIGHPQMIRHLRGR